MTAEVLLLLLATLMIYMLVMWTHSMRGRTRLGPMYALLGCITALMSWVTDIGLSVDAAGITFMIGSTVFYTSLLLGVFLIYVFDGPSHARIAILTIAGISALVPLVAWLLNQLAGHSGQESLSFIPVPDLRINSASVLATLVDMFFFLIAWEFLGRSRKGFQLWSRIFLSLLGVMWLDVLLFSTMAFAGTPEYFSIMKGTLTSRLFISLFASPFIYFYLGWQENRMGMDIENRPVMSILHQVASMQEKLGAAHREIEERRQLETEREKLILELKATLAHVKTLEGLLPICCSCKKIHVISSEDDKPSSRWVPLDEYVSSATDVRFSHGICDECSAKLYPELEDHRH